MFHSNNSSDSSCNNNVIPFTSISDDYPSSPFSNNDVNPNNTLFKTTHYPSLPFDHYPYSSFFHFSPTFNIIDDHHHEDHHEFLFSHQFLTTLDTILPMEVTLDHHQMPIPDKDTTTVTVNNNNNNNNNKEIKSSGEKCCNNSAGEKINWVDTKRCLTSKKDRHSKIVTAQGPRDRRMRLSLKVAKPFFTLQDMLGFDKASKTVEWLMIHSKEAIKELARSRRGDGGGSKSVDSSISESCEVVSEVDICNPSAVTTDQDHDQQVGNNNTSSVHKKEKRVTRPSRKPMFLPQAKESREKARARARERTIGKIWSRSIPLMQQYTQGNHFNDNQNLLNPFSSPHGFETGDESGSRSQEVKSSLEVVADFEELSSHSLEESMINTSNSSASKIFNYHQEIKTSQGLNLNINHNFPENWDINESTENSSFCATSSNIRLSTGNTHNPITSPFCLTTSTARFPSQFADFQFFDKPLQTYYSQSP